MKREGIDDIPGDDSGLGERRQFVRREIGGIEDFVTGIERLGIEPLTEEEQLVEVEHVCRVGVLGLVANGIEPLGLDRCACLDWSWSPS